MTVEQDNKVLWLAMQTRYRSDKTGHDILRRAMSLLRFCCDLLTDVRFSWRTLRQRRGPKVQVSYYNRLRECCKVSSGRQGIYAI